MGDGDEGRAESKSIRSCVRACVDENCAARGRGMAAATVSIYFILASARYPANRGVGKTKRVVVHVYVLYESPLRRVMAMRACACTFDTLCLSGLRSSRRGSRVAGVFARVRCIVKASDAITGAAAWPH